MSEDKLYLGLEAGRVGCLLEYTTRVQRREIKANCRKGGSDGLPGTKAGRTVALQTGPGQLGKLAPIGTTNLAYSTRL